jgi:hypothetical protein
MWAFSRKFRQVHNVLLACLTFISPLHSSALHSSVSRRFACNHLLLYLVFRQKILLDILMFHIVTFSPELPTWLSQTDALSDYVVWNPSFLFSFAAVLAGSKKEVICRFTGWAMFLLASDLMAKYRSFLSDLSLQPLWCYIAFSRMIFLNRTKYTQSVHPIPSKVFSRSRCEKQGCTQWYKFPEYGQTNTSGNVLSWALIS